MAGIKETEEMMVGMNEVSLYLVSVLKDGLQLADFGAVMNKLLVDKAFRDKIEAAYEGAKLIPKEVKDLDLGEVLKLAELQLSYIPKYMAALKNNP